jgi:hypothetical protein
MRELLREARDPVSPKSFHLWFGALGPPLLWGAQLLLSDGLFELGCSRGFGRPEIYGLPLKFWALLEVSVFLALDVLAGVVAYRAHRLLTQDPPPAPPTPYGRARAMALVGMASASIYGLLLVYGLLPPLFLRTCERLG